MRATEQGKYLLVKVLRIPEHLNEHDTIRVGMEVKVVAHRTSDNQYLFNTSRRTNKMYWRNTGSIAAADCVVVGRTDC